MFLLNGNPISLDQPFTTPDGTQYPANWLRLASVEDKEAIGITEVSNPPSWDQRYYWGYDDEGELIPKDLDGLKTLHISQTKETANTLLGSTDWYIIRKYDRDVDVPVGITSYRADVVTTATQRENLITGASDVASLKALYESSESGVGTSRTVNPPAMPEWPTNS